MAENTKPNGVEFNCGRTAYPLIEVSDERMTELQSGKSEFGIGGLHALPVWWSWNKHLAPDTKEPTGMWFIRVWPHIMGELDGKPVGGIKRL